MASLIDRVLWFLPTSLRMKAAWEVRALRNPMHYVADFRWRWNEEEFFATGRDDVDRFLSEAGWSDTSGRRLVEVGCGLGRMSRHFAARYAHVTALDISSAMVRRARRLNAGHPNIEFVVGTGSDLSGIPDASHDDAVSYVVFQHIPDPEVVHRYAGELVRVLRRGGRFRFQARNDAAHGEADTYRGTSIDVGEMRATLERAGGVLRRVTGEGTQYCYFEGTRG